MSSVKLIVSVAENRLWLYDAAGVLQRIYRVSTSRFGAGQEQGSLQTPLGHHRIRALIGRGAPLGTIFVARRATGERLWPLSKKLAGGRDYVLTRIFWLCGEEPGWNRLGSRDTQRRFIYLHGTHDEAALGSPASHGCVRMSNVDIVELAMLVSIGTPLWIVPSWRG